MVVAENHDLPECLICGGRFKSVGHHVRKAHGITAMDYRDMYGIPRSRKLTSAETRDTFAAQARARGLGTDQEARRAASDTAVQKSRVAIKGLIASGRVWGGRNRHPRETIAQVVSRAESGERPYQIVREMGIAWSAFHGGLKRHPDLLARYQALPIRRGRPRGVH